MTQKQTIATGTRKAAPKRRDRDEYTPFLNHVREHFAEAAGDGPLFMTDAKHLFAEFLKALPAAERQHHNCSACHRFTSKYGGLVAIDEEGNTNPVMWSGYAPGIYGNAFRALRKAVSRAKVVGVFVSSEEEWGWPVTGDWRHMAVTPPQRTVWTSRVQTAGQRRAEKREDYRILRQAIADFGPALLANAQMALEAEALYRSEKVLGPVKWLRELQQRIEGGKSKAHRDNIAWLAVAKAPAGFCHVRSTMAGTLLEDLAAGMPFEAVKRRFDSKMEPLKYQRPQAAPSSENIAKAEKIVAALQTAGALRRRFARIEDIQEWIWRPKRKAKTDGLPGSVFGHLEPKRQPFGSVPIPVGQPVTWDKFSRTVLPSAETLELLVPTHGTYIAMVTAEDTEAPPIIQWDLAERRNPVSWYVYSDTRSSRQWNLAAGTWAEIVMVTRLPARWGSGKGLTEDAFAHQGDGAILVLDGCRDISPTGGAALFPEVLKAEYREVRSTIEAYSRRAELSGADEATACGWDLRKGSRYRSPCQVRVRSALGETIYTIDRWD